MGSGIEPARFRRCLRDQVNIPSVPVLLTPVLLFPLTSDGFPFESHLSLASSNFENLFIEGIGASDVTSIPARERSSV